MKLLGKLEVQSLIKWSWCFCHGVTCNCGQQMGVKAVLQALLLFRELLSTILGCVAARSSSHKLVAKNSQIVI